MNNSIRQCNTCGLEAYNINDLEQFCTSKLSKFGRQNMCKLCKNEIVKTKYMQKEYTREYRIKNKDKLKSKMYVWSKNWRENNRHKRSATEAKRRYYKINNTIVEPNDQYKIQIIYRTANVMSKLGKTKYHVDHIIPLSKGGAHSIENLQILEASRNMSKNNKIIDTSSIKFKERIRTLIRKGII